MVSCKEAPSVGQFRWSEKNLHGVRVQRKRVIVAVVAVERYPNEAAAPSALTVLLAEIKERHRRWGQLMPQGEGKKTETKRNANKCAKPCGCDRPYRFKSAMTQRPSRS